LDNTLENVASWNNNTQQNIHGMENIEKPNTWAAVVKKKRIHMIGTGESHDKIKVIKVQDKPLLPPRVHIFASRISADTQEEEIAKWVTNKKLKLLSIEALAVKFRIKISTHILRRPKPTK